MNEPIPLYTPVRDGEWVTEVCRCGEQVTRYRREMPEHRNAKRRHRCQPPKGKAA